MYRSNKKAFGEESYVSSLFAGEKLFPGRAARRCTLFLISSVLVGCANQQVVAPSSPDAASTADVCGQLGYLFENSADGFRAIRNKPSFQNKITLWQSVYQPLESKCEIWQWSNRYSYVCSRVLPDEKTAENAYNIASDTIAQCLGPQWQQKKVALPDGKGEKTEYLYNGMVRGSTQRVNTKGLFSSDWTVYVLISSPESR